jgi:hypothetical protein
MRTRFAAGLLLVVALGSLLSGSLAAQSKPIELGLDMGLAIDFGGGATNTYFDLPTGVLRAGLWMTDKVSIEPNLWVSISHAGGGTDTRFSVAPALLYHFKTDPTMMRPFVAVFPGLYHQSGGGGSQFFAGAGLGALFPMQERLALRAEALFTHYFSSDSFSDFNELGVRVGFSFFTH